MADPVADYLTTVKTSDAVRAQAWDAVNQASDDADLAKRLQALPVPNDVRAKLFDLKPAATPLPVFRSATSDDAPTTDWSERLGLHEPTASPALGFVRGAGTAAVDLAEGAASGLASTVYHGGDLIRRGLGMDRVIDTPQAQRAMRAPDTVAGAIGKGGEQAAEFALPLGEVSKGVEGAALLTRMAAEGAASGAVAGVQSGGDMKQMGTAAAGGAVLPVATALVGAGARAATRAAAGAGEGGLPGAIASLVRTTTPMSSKAMLVSALKPSNGNLGFMTALDRAMPEIKASEAAIGKPVETANEMMAAVKDAKQRVWSQYEAIAGPRANSMVDGTPVADAMVKSIPKRTLMQDPQLAAAIAAKADAYRQSFPLQDMEQLLTETNADLEGYYKKFPMAQRKALMANPEIAHTVAEASALRDAIYSTLDTDGQPAARELKQRYGALMNVEDTLQRRVNVAARQQPESLSEQIGQVRAAGDIARGLWKLKNFDVSGAADIAAGAAMRNTAKFLKEQQTTDALIRRAMAGVKNLPVPIAVPQGRTVAGLLERGAIPGGAVPDASFVQGVPAVPAQSGRLALPAGRTPIPMGPGADPSFVRGAPAVELVKEGDRWVQKRVYGSGAR